jgi:hypothetical protein
VANVVVHAILSVPTPFQVFDVQPALTLPAHVPFVWLPTFLVPMAFAGHFLGLRQALAADPS